MISSALLAGSFKFRLLCSSHNRIGTQIFHFFFKKHPQKIVFYNVSLSNLKNVLQRNLGKSRTSECIFRVSGAQILKIYLLSGNHGCAVVSSICLLVFPKKTLDTSL